MTSSFSVLEHQPASPDLDLFARLLDATGALWPLVAKRSRQIEQERRVFVRTERGGLAGGRHVCGASATRCVAARPPQRSRLARPAERRIFERRSALALNAGP